MATRKYTKETTVGGQPVRRRAFLKGICGAVALSPALRKGSRAAESERGLWVGVAVEEITPPLEVGLLMSSSAGRWEAFESVRLPLQARALVLSDGKRRFALVGLDLIGLAGQAVGGIDAFKAEVAHHAGGRFRPSDMVLASSHTHTGPESIALTDLRHTKAFAEWTNELVVRIGSAIRRAAESAAPCRLVLGQVQAGGMAVNRRIVTRRGIASVRRKLPADEVIGPEGPVDDRLRVAALVGRNGRPLAMVVHFAAHPVLEMCIKHVSPDYPGEMLLELERRHPGCTPLFLQGACGNINPPTMERTVANCRRYGQRLAELADEAFKRARPAAVRPLVWGWRKIQLPWRDLDGKPQPSPLETSIGALRLGDAAWGFLPGEPFVEIGLDIVGASPWPFTAVVGYADDYIGYLPTDRAFDNGGYEIGPGRWSRVDRGSQRIVTDGAIQLLHSLRKTRPETRPD
ncbi:MAG TPA: hypothetical protein EYH34_02540 [Planctomycetes bacterium]|nr:hypothetical protein [Planctomycetota bacterium]